jgi:hypothetical protein
MKNDWNIVIIANEYHKKSMKRVLTLFVLGIAETYTPMKTHHTLCNIEVQFYNPMVRS